MKKATDAAMVFRQALIRGTILIAAIALVGSMAGFLVAGNAGVASALIGAALALGFTSLTLVSLIVGRKLSLAGFFGVVLGGWLVKLLGFALLVGGLRNADFIDGPVLFFTLVAAVLGSLTIDSLAVLRARIPVVEG